MINNYPRQDYPRQPEDLPNEHVLCYPDNLRGDYLSPFDGFFNCIKISAELPKLYLQPLSDEDI